MQRIMENNMKAMFTQFAARFQAQSGVSEVSASPMGTQFTAKFPAQSSVSEISAVHMGKQFQAQSGVSEIHTTHKGKPSQIESKPDPYILELQDKGGYDSDGKSIHEDGRSHPMSYTTSQPPPEPTRSEAQCPASPTGSTHSSDFDSDNLFIRLKRQRENLLNKVAIAGGFDRECQVPAHITGVSSDMVGASIAPPNLTLPWSESLSEHVSVHDKIISGKMARNGTPITHSSFKVHPWKIGELFRESDLSKSTLFPKAYQPYPPTEKCSAEAVKIESEPHEQPFEHVDAQGLPIGSSIDISQGKISLSESTLVTQENLIQRLIGSINSLDTLIKFAVSQHEHLSSESMLEVLRHARFDIAASSSYAWRTAHNIRLLRRQAAIDLLQGLTTHPPLNQANFQDLYRAPLNSTSLFGGKLADIHQKLVQNLQVRPILVGTPNENQSGMNRSNKNLKSQPFRKPFIQLPPKKGRTQKRQNYLPQGPPTKKPAPAGSSSLQSEPTKNPPIAGKGRGTGLGGQSEIGRGGGLGASQ
jgi:hypothetical protein